MNNEIKNIINSNLTLEEKLDALYDYHDNDLAIALSELDTISRIKFYEIFDETRLSDIISYLEDPSFYLEEMGLDKAADVLEEMDSDDAVDVLEELEDEHALKLKELMESDALSDIELIQSYAEDEVGSLMTTNFIVLPKSSTIKEAMKSLIDQASTNDNVNLLYVTENNKYYGTIELRDLFIARAKDSFLDLIKTTYPKFYAKEKVSDAYPTLTDYDLSSYPVLNEKDELVGVITSSDIIELVSEEMAEDFAKLGGLTGDLSDNKSMFKTILNRLPWLLILLVLGVIISMVISSFSNVLSSLTAIVFFQSLVLGMSGNIGTQSLAVTIRSLTDEKINKKEIFKIVFKEFKVGFLNGLISGILSAIVIGFYLYIFKVTIADGIETTLFNSFKVSFVIGLALLCSMSISSLFGSLIPIFFKKIKIDPAVASGPFITTLNDIIAVVTYYGFALIFLMSMVSNI